MRPTDKEIEIQKNRFPASSVVDKGNEHIFEEGFEKGAKWARDFDPWYYIEDGDFPPHQTKVLAYFANNIGVLVAELRGKDQRFWEDEEASMYELNEVKCWMHIPTPKK